VKEFRMGESGSTYSSVFLHAAGLRPCSTESRKPTQKERERNCDVILISMPFGSARLPSLGLGLLKASIREISAKILYFTFVFAERMGLTSYQWVAAGNPRVTCAVGEWIFSSALFESAPSSTQQYLDEVLRRESGPRLFPQKILREIVRAREEAAPFLDACVEQVLGYSPRIVGFTNSFQQQVASLGLAKRLKALRQDVSIVFGGANCESVMGLEILRQFPYVDLVVSGEGDVIFPELVHRLLHELPLEDLQGVYTQRSPAVTTRSTSPATAPSVCDMEALPYPDYDDFFEQWNTSRVRKKLSPILLFESSRGCWWGAKHHCTFCGLNGMTMAFRSKPARRAMDELAYLTKRYRVSSVAVVDNILDMKYFNNFVPELAHRGLRLNLYYEVKANLSKEQVRQLFEAGITEIQPGIESLSDSVLHLMRKGVTGLQNIQLLKWCRETGILPGWNFLWGFPGESPNEYARMAGIIPLLTHLPPPDQGMPICLYRFSPNFDNSAEMGFTSIAAGSAYSWIYPFPADVLFNLAYYFDYEYRDRRDVAAYTNALVERISEWQETYETSELFYSDNGTRLLLWDFRPIALRNLTILEGLQRELYLACDKVSSVAQLARAYGDSDGSSQAVEDALGPLLKKGLMIRDGERVLSLAVRLTEASAARGGFRKSVPQVSNASQRILTSSRRRSNLGSLRRFSRKGSNREIMG
jgi:ribosomal peptide maturation radical SAM protein 1